MFTQGKKFPSDMIGHLALSSYYAEDLREAQGQNNSLFVQNEIYFLTIGKLYIPSHPTPNRVMFFKLDIVSPARWATTLKWRIYFYAHAVNPLLLLKLTDEGEEYDDEHEEMYNAAESSGKLLISCSLMDHV